MAGIRIDITTKEAERNAKALKKDLISLGKAGDKANDSAGKLSKGLGSAGKAAAVVSAAVVAAGAAITAVMVKAVGKAAEFESALTDMAKVTSEPLDQIKAKIQGIDPALGDSTELVKGYYQTISAGVSDPVEALDVLTTAAGTAKAAHIEQEEVVKGITKVMAAYASENVTAAESADLLFTMEKAGQTSVKELIPYIGELSAKSAALGVSQTQLGAAFGAVTKLAGNTSEAATQYKAIMTSLMKPSEDLTRLLVEYGGAQGAIQQLGFDGTLKLIADAAGGNASKLADLMGSSEALSGVLAITANDFAAFNDSLGIMKERTGAADEATKNWRDTFEAASETFKNTMGNVLIEVGSVILPKVTEQLNKMSSWVAAHQSEIVGAFDAIYESILSAGEAIQKAWDITPMVVFYRATVEIQKRLGLLRTGDAQETEDIISAIMSQAEVDRLAAAMANAEKLAAQGKLTEDAITANMTAAFVARITAMNENAAKQKAIIDKAKADYEAAEDLKTAHLKLQHEWREAAAEAHLASLFDNVADNNDDLERETADYVEKVAGEHEDYYADRKTADDLATSSAVNNIGNIVDATSEGLQEAAQKWKDYAEYVKEVNSDLFPEEDHWSGPTADWNPSKGTRYRTGAKPAYSKGTSYVPRTEPAMVHKGEAVLNKQGRQNIIDYFNDGKAPTAKAGNTYNVTIAPQYMTGDRRSIQAVAVAVKRQLEDMEKRAA